VAVDLLHFGIKCKEIFLWR